jgi:hypothetical protein
MHAGTKSNYRLVTLHLLITGISFFSTLRWDKAYAAAPPVCAVPARLADAAGMRAVFAVFCPVWLFGPEMLQSL